MCKFASGISDGKKQKFNRGDIVRIADNLGPYMSHFESGIDAIVCGSYSDKFGGTDTDSYTVYIKGSGETSWYHEEQLTLIDAGRLDLLSEWKQKDKADWDMWSNLDWIFENSHEVLDKQSGPSIQTLFTCLGGGSLWGSSGEGFVYYENAQFTMRIAEVFLRNKNKAGWLRFCEDAKKNVTK